jgi:hypothetical protein
MVFFSLAMFLPVLFFAIGIVDSAAPLILPLALFVVGLFWMLYYRLFGEESVPVVRQPQFVIPAAPQPVYSPPPQSGPAYQTPVEKPQQQSVIENTTRSLGQQ